LAPPVCRRPLLTETDPVSRVLSDVDSDPYTPMFISSGLLLAKSFALSMVLVNLAISFFEVPISSGYKSFLVPLSPATSMEARY